MKKIACSLLAAFAFAPVAFASESLVVSTTSVKGQDLTLRFPLATPVASVSQGALLCGSEPLSVRSARVWMDHDGHGHGGPAVTLRPLDGGCVQLNDLRFEHEGAREIQVKLTGGDEATFAFDVARALPTTTRLTRAADGSVAAITFVPARAPTLSTTAAIVCSNNPGEVTSAQLWMPNMGHGSSHTRLSPAGEGCTRVDDLAFAMGGRWELRGAFADAETFTFAFDVGR